MIRKHNFRFFLLTPAVTGAMIRFKTTGPTRLQLERSRLSRCKKSEIREVMGSFEGRNLNRVFSNS